MNPARKTQPLFLMAMLLAVAVAHANEKRATVPEKVISARTVYVDNQTNDAGLQHDAYLGLSKWGRYGIVDSAQKADLVLRLHGSSAVKFVPAGEANATYNPKLVSATTADSEELAPPGCTRLTVIDPKSGITLWSEVRKTTNPQEKGRLLEGLHDAVDQQEKKHGK
jgi:hypothetical protein